MKLVFLDDVVWNAIGLPSDESNLTGLWVRSFAISSVFTPSVRPLKGSIEAATLVLKHVKAGDVAIRCEPDDIQNGWLV